MLTDYKRSKGVVLPLATVPGRSFAGEPSPPMDPPAALGPAAAPVSPGTRRGSDIIRRVASQAGVRMSRVSRNTPVSPRTRVKVL